MTKAFTYEGRRVKMRTFITKNMKLVLISIVMLSGLTLSYGLSWGADHTIPSPGYMPQVVWTRGCTPTSASMVLGYYDNDDGTGSYVGRGRLIDYWMDLSMYVDGRNGIIHSVPNLLEQLRIYMSTDGEGKTLDQNIGAGIRGLTSDKGYFFDSSDCIGDSGDNNDCWDDIVWEISLGRPFVWSIGYEGHGGHSLAAWGYRDDGYVIVYNTWNLGRDDWFYATFDNNGVFTNRQRVTSAVPDGTDGDSQVTLQSPVGGEYLAGGQIFTVEWYQWGTFISNVDLRYSDDGGQNFNYISQNLPSVSGWNSYDWRVPNISSDKVRVNVIAYDPSRNYSWYGSVASDGTKSNLAITPDAMPPIGFVFINGGATYTTSPAVTLTLSAYDILSGIYHMCISNTNSCGAWEPYNTTKTWTLAAGDGTKTVYASFVDNAGNVSNAVSASIILDTIPPSGSITINNGDGYTRSTSVKLGLSASDANGVPQMCISNTSSCSSWEPFTTSKSWTLPTGDGTKTVYAIFSDGAGNLSTVYSHSIILDTTAPAGSVTINGGATFTNSTAVTLALSSSDATDMCIRNSTMVACAILWQPYATTKQWPLLDGDGTKTVYVMFRDGVGNVSPVYSDSITLDTSAPTGSVTINGGAAYTKSPSVNLTLSATDPSGVTKMCIRNSTTFPCGLGLLWKPYSTTKPWTLLSGDGDKTVYVVFSDGAGNTSPVYSDSITLDTSAPTGSVTINGGAAYTKSPSVNLTLSATDPSGVTKMCIRNSTTFPCGLGLLWEPYSTTKPWTLLSGDGDKTVYAVFMDGAGNTSPTYSHSITLDATAPVNGTLSAVARDGQVLLNWSGFSDAGSGVATYTLVFSTTDHPAFRSEGTQIYSGTRTSYLHKGLTNGTMYFYRVCATDNVDNTSIGATAAAIPGASQATNFGEGTVGTEIDIIGSGYGKTKGRVLVGSVVLKILKWTDALITCQLTNPLSPGTYDVTIQPKGVAPITVSNGFTVMPPNISSPEPTHASAGGDVTIHGSFFGTKKGKVALGGKNCKVTTWTMDSKTGESEIKFVVPKGLSPGAKELKVTNGVGADTTNFTVD